LVDAIDTELPKSKTSIAQNGAPKTKMNAIDSDTLRVKSKPVSKSNSSVLKDSNSTSTPKNQFDRPALLDPAKQSNGTSKKIVKNAKSKTELKTFFTVQIAASTNAAKDLPKYIDINDVHSIKGNDGFVRFVVGKFNTLNAARNRLEQLKNAGHKEAFITAYDGDKRITVNEAVELLK